MKRTFSQSHQAAQAYEQVVLMQKRFVIGLEKLLQLYQRPEKFKAVEWLRDEGKHGGGIRYQIADSTLYGRGSVNVSQVHYDDKLEKELGSATAISTIIHPNSPLAPSVHIHMSWTEMKSGQGYWRLMADLNPSNENEAHKTQFFTALKGVAAAQFDIAKEQGERYFYIPALGRHRGVAHFYLENYSTHNPEADLKLATAVGEAAIDSYLDILAQSFCSSEAPTEEQQKRQLAYHTLYLFQVLTLDRGTTTGLLIHDQNDVGIMGSLPAYVDRNLLASWVGRMQSPQDKLLQRLIDCLPAQSPSLIDEGVKQKLAAIVRAHYSSHPEAIAMQASGDVIPPTVHNHRG